MLSNIAYLNLFSANNFLYSIVRILKTKSQRGAYWGACYQISGAPSIGLLRYLRNGYKSKCNLIFITFNAAVNRAQEQKTLPKLLLKLQKEYKFHKELQKKKKKNFFCSTVSVFKFFKCQSGCRRLNSILLCTMLFCFSLNFIFILVWNDF